MIKKAMLFMLLFMLPLVSAATLIPPANYDYRNIYSIYNVSNLSANRFCLAGDCQTTWPSGVGGSTNLSLVALSFMNRTDWTTIDNYPAACGVGNAVISIGDTLTCQAFATSDTWNTTAQMIAATNNSLNARSVACGNITGAATNLCNISASTDTNETTRVSRIVSTNCTGQVVAGFYSNGTAWCEADDTGASTSDGNNYTTSISVPGTSTKTLNLARNGMINLTASWTDIDTDTWNTTAQMRAAVNNSAINIGGNAATVTNGIYTTSTWTGGDLGGTGLAATVSDDSHNHANGTITSVDWSKLQTYPAACAVGNAITALGDSPTCSTFLTTTPYQNEAAGWSNASTGKPVTGANDVRIGAIGANENRLSFAAYGVEGLSFLRWYEPLGRFEFSGPLDVHNALSIDGLSVGTSNLTIAQVVAGVGNWSSEKTSYLTLANAASNYPNKSGVETISGYWNFAPTTNVTFSGVGTVIFDLPVFFKDNVTITTPQAAVANTSLNITDISGVSRISMLVTGTVGNVTADNFVGALAGTAQYANTSTHLMDQDSSYYYNTSLTLLKSGGSLTNAYICRYDGTGIDCDRVEDASGACGANAVCMGGHTHVGVNETYGSGWDADVDYPEKDDVYDYLHLIDWNDNGVADKLNGTSIITAVGNWSANFSSYSTKVAADLLYAPIAVGNWAGNQSSYSTVVAVSSVNTTALNALPKTGGTMTGDLVLETDNCINWGGTAKICGNSTTIVITGG